MISPVYPDDDGKMKIKNPTFHFYAIILELLPMAIGQDSSKLSEIYLPML
jgi:hypothetical protein